MLPLICEKKDDDLLSILRYRQSVCMGTFLEFAMGTRSQSIVLVCVCVCVCVKTGDGLSTSASVVSQSVHGSEAAVSVLTRGQHTPHTAASLSTGTHTYTHTHARTHTRIHTHTYKSILIAHCTALAASPSVQCPFFVLGFPSRTLQHPSRTHTHTPTYLTGPWHGSYYGDMDATRLLQL